MIYCIDTSAWIDAVRDYNPASTLFESFWEFLETQIGAGTIIAPDEVHQEMKVKLAKNPREFGTWLAQVQKTLFIPHDRALQTRFKAVVAKYPDLTTKGKPFAKSDGDAWVIGLAQERRCTVVAHESPKPSAKKPFKIPDVCGAEGVRCIRLHEMLDEIQGI